MKNEISAKELVEMLRKSVLKAMHPKTYDKYYEKIENLLYGLDDSVIKDLSSLEGLTDEKSLDTALREKSDGELDTIFYAIHQELRTWANPIKKARAKAFLNAKRDRRKKRAIIIFLALLGVVAVIASVFVILEEVEILDSGKKIGGIISAVGFSVDVLSFVIERLSDLCSSKRQIKIIESGAVDAETSISIEGAEQEFLNIYKKEYDKSRRYREEIADAIRLCGTTEWHRGRKIRKAKRIFKKTLNYNPKDANGYVGLLRIISKNFTEYRSPQIKKYVEAIEKYRGQSGLLIDDEYDGYKANFDKAEEIAATKSDEKNRDRQTKKEKRAEFFARAVPILQQIGIYTVLILPIALSIAVIILDFCLPVKSFEDYTGWLFTIIYGLNCLSILGLLVLWIVLFIVSENPNFDDGFGIGWQGELVFVLGFLVAEFFYPIVELSDGKPLWSIVCFVITLVLWLGLIIWGLIKHKDRCVPRFLLICLGSVFFGFAIFVGPITFSNFVKSTHDYYEENSDGTYTYVICDISTEHLEIPSEYKGKSITAISRDEHFELPNLKSVMISDSVTSIGNHAFEGCSGLTSITIPNSVTSIGYSAFEGCTKIEEATMPTVAISDIPQDNLKKVVITSGNSIRYSAFKGCSTLTSVTIPDSVTSIGGSAFEGCSGLTSITIPNSVTSIEYSAFEGCSGLTSITVPDSVTSIGSSAFEGCSGLTSITIPNSVTSIEYSAFEGCSGLTSITIPDSVTSIDSSAFKGCSGLTSIIIPDGVTWIWSSAFEGCSGLTSVTIPDSVTNILTSAFDGCTKIEEATMPTVAISYIPQNNLKKVVITSGNSIGTEEFKNCSTLTSISIPNSVTSIGASAFEECWRLTSVTIGNGVTSIGASAFEGCSGLTLITIPDSVTSIGERAFYGCWSIRSITLPFVGNGAEITYFSYLFGSSSYSYSWYVPNSLQEVIITGGVSIGEGAFYRCDKLTSISIPDSVTSIGIRAFEGCSGLTSITIPDSVTSIGQNAFVNCGALHKIKGISYVDKWAVGCDSTVSKAELLSDTVGIADFAFADNKSLTAVILNEGILYIGDSAFKNTGMKTIIIPQSLVSIGNSAFSGCELSEVVFGNVEEWYADGTYIPSSELSDSTKAATYLTSTYVGRLWRRGNN